MNWADKAVFYHIYPLGFCGAPMDNDFMSSPQERIQKVADWAGHIADDLGCDALYLGPIFESDHHGYDTADYRLIDRRLGTNQGFREVVDRLHNKGIRVVLDGVFHHTGRHFGPFVDVLQKRWDSVYKDWFFLNFDGDNAFHDGLWYDCWEGHQELVKLNLGHPDVRRYLLESAEGWIREFDIDGIRLDVAYCLDHSFMQELSARCRGVKPDFFLLGEVVHMNDNLKRLLDPDMLHSVTNYECYKGLYSSFNDQNLFEIAHSLERLFGNQPWCLFTGKHLYNFADNHDVSRFATALKCPDQMEAAYTLLYTMPGIPSVYYGSEWGIPGDKKDGDGVLRPCLELEAQKACSLTQHLKKLAEVKKKHPSLWEGDYQKEFLTNKQFAFSRNAEGESLLIFINAEGQEANFQLNRRVKGTELLTGQAVDLEGNFCLPAYGSAVVKVE